jgi:hypothetical protein
MFRGQFDLRHYVGLGHAKDVLPIMRQSQTHGGPPIRCD